MTTNTGLPETESFGCGGCKGGSETGVISSMYLLQSKKGEWFVVSGSWNDEKTAVDSDRFVLMMQKTVKILREKSL